MKRILLLTGMLAWCLASAQITAPFTQSFPNTTIPVGWANTSSSTSANANWKFSGTPGNPSMSGTAYNPPVILDHTQNSGSIAWSDGSTPAVADCGLLTDSIDISALSSLYIEFWYYSNNVTNPGDNNTLYLNFYDGTQWNDSIWGYAGDGSAWQYGAVDLSSYTTSGKVLFEFVVDQTTATTAFYNDILLDDISVTNVPTCPLPLNLAVSNITSSGADITWNTVTAATNGYEVIYGAQGFNPATGGTSATTVTNSYTITGQSGATNYDVYVISDCGTANGISDTSGPVSYITLCVPFTAPYSRDFDSDLTGSTPLCWDSYVSGGSGLVDVYRFGTPNSTPNHLRLYSGNSTASDTVMAISPQFSDLTASNKQVRFFVSTSNVAQVLYIGTVSSQAGATAFNALDTISFTATNTPVEVVVSVNAANGYNGTDQYVAFRNSNTNSFTSIYIDDFNYEVIPACPKLFQVTQTGATDSSFTVSYNSGGNNFDIEWGPAGFAQGTGCFATVTSTNGMLTVTNSLTPGCINTLQPNTAYHFYIRNNCTGSSNGVSVWEGPITVVTACAPFMAPYYNGFENDSVNQAPICWNNYLVGANPQFSAASVYAFGTPYAGSQHVRFYNYNNDTTMLVTPNFSDLTADDKRINFYAQTTTTASGNDLVIGTVSSPDDPASFTAIDTFDLSGQYSFYSVDITTSNGYNGIDNYIAFYHASTSSFRTYYIDEFNYEQIPACVPPLQNTLGVSFTTANSAQAFWGSGSSGTTTQIEWGSTGFSPGTGTSIGRATVAGTIDTYTIGSLSPQTTYEFYIRDSCALSGLSPWVGPLSFTTKCLITQPAVLPFNDGFESYSGGPYFEDQDFCASSYYWDFESSTPNGRLRLQAGTAFYKNGVQAFTLDHTPSPSTAEDNFITLAIDLSSYTASNGIELNFSYMSHGQETNPTNRVWVRGTPTDPWVQIYDLNVTNGQNGVYFDVTNIDIVGPLAAASQSVGAGTQIRFGQSGRFTAFNINFSDGYTFDDISLVEVTCPTPSGLNISGLIDTAATLDWNANTNAIGYEVWFGPQGFYQGSQTIGGVKNYPGTNSLLVDTLSSKSCYEFAIRYICGPGDTSGYAGPFQFCTPCSPVSAPYFENWDALTTGKDLGCYASIEDPAFATNNFSGVNVINSTFANPFSPPNQIELDNSSSTAPLLVVSPPTTDLTAGDKRVVFRARQSFAATPPSTLIVGTMSNPQDASTFNAVDTVVLTATTPQDRLVVNFTVANGYNGTDNYYAFAHGLEANFRTIYLDDISYDFIPSCPEPTNAATLNTTDVSADLFFTPGGVATSYNVVYGVPGLVPSPSHPNYQSFTTSTPTITGLTPNTVYEWYVRDSCSAGDVSIWRGPYTFQTVCAPIAAPLFQDFENHTLGFYEGLDNCWFLENTVVKTSATSGFGWELRNTAQTGSGTTTGADRDNTLAPAIGGKFFNADVSYGSAGDSSMLISPIVDISGLTNPELEYHLHRYGTQMGDFYVDIYDGTQWNNGIHAYTTQAGMQTSQSDAYTDTIIDLAPYIGTTNFRVRFRVISNGCCPGDNGLDDIRISDPITGDLDVVEADFIKGPCLSNNDSIFMEVVNTVSQAAIDFSVNPLDAFYNVTGPVNTSGSLTINSGTLAVGDTLRIEVGSIDLSQPGSYNLKTWIDTSFINAFTNRDTIDNVSLNVLPDFQTAPSQVVLASANDSTEICAESSFFGGGSFLITEQCHFKTTSGAPAGGWPAYLTTDDYIEITGVPGSDLGGITLEQWNTTSMAGTYTFPQGTLLSPNGTAIIAVGQLGASVPSPANFYYHGNGNYTGLWSSSTAAGRILKDASDNIMDAVISNAFTWPAASGVTSADWTGTVPATGGTSGLRLEGPDLNSSVGWVSSATSAQNPNTVNSGVPIPQSAGAPGLTWTRNGVTVDTTACITVGPYTASGTYTYIASFTNPCGSFTDTVTVIVPGCSAPSNLAGQALSTTSVSLSWDTTATGATNFDVEYGPAGFAIGAGTRVSTTGNSHILTGLATNLCQDFYVRAACSANDTSAWIGPVNLCPEEVPCDNLDQYATGLLGNQSALLKGWAGNAGDGAISTTRAQSTPNSLRIYDTGPGAATDVVALFDTISTGAWDVGFSLYVENNDGAYYNIQQNYDAGGPANLWGGDVYFQGNGTATVTYGNPAVVAGTFTYAQGQWIDINTIIDLANDSIWIEYNGTSTGVGWQYSLYNLGQPLQFNGVNFYTGTYLTATYDIDYYMDDFCVLPYVPSGVCAPPTALAASNLACDSATLGWTSPSGSQGSIVVYGTTGFNPVTGGTVVPATGNSMNVSGLTPGTAYDFYVLNICAADTSAPAGPVSFTTLSGPLSAAFTVSLGSPTLNDLTANFDASGSQGAVTYNWDFGDGGTATVMSPSYLYSANGTYVVTLAISGPCGNDTITDTVVVAGISLADHMLARTLQLYPNPTEGRINLSFETDRAGDVEITILDLSGKRVLSFTEEDFVGSYDKVLNLEALADGTYMIKVSAPDAQVIKRVIKH